MLHEALRDATRRFQEAGITNAAGEARLLAAHYLGVPATEIFLHLREPAPVGLLTAIESREGREPLQHIVGTAPFGPLEILVGPGVFIPRPETGCLRIGLWKSLTLVSFAQLCWISAPAAEL